MMKIGESDTIKLARSVLDSFYLCNYCLGRQFPEFRRGMHDADRGAALKELLHKQVHTDECYICQGLMNRIPFFVEEVLTRLLDYQFETFHIGASLQTQLVEREDELRSEFKLRGGETLKSAFTREVGRAIAEKTGKKVRFRSPDLVVIIEPSIDEIRIESRPLYIFGRYLKIIRGIPQKSRVCKICRGIGCDRCNFTGSSVERSVESIVVDKTRRLFQAEDVKISWIGSEDSQSLVLGDGRPFFAEVRRPRLRKTDLARFRRIKRDSSVPLKEMKVLDSKPSFSPNFKVKTLVRIKSSHNILKKRLREVERQFKEITVQISSSKGGKIREKRIYSVKAKLRGRDSAELLIYCDGGLSIRGFVTGERGEVEPNISSILGSEVYLDKEAPFDILEIQLA